MLNVLISEKTPYTKKHARNRVRTVEEHAFNRKICLMKKTELRQM
jgi:hypothetical protein